MKPQMREADVIAMRWERKRGATLKEIAKKYGLSQGYISHVCAGHYYPNLGGPISTETPATKTHCVHGHEYTPENTVITSAGRRNCRQCKNIQNVKSKHKKRAEAGE